MCLLAVYVRTVPDWPLVVAANREEFYGRQGTVPGVLGEAPRIVAGRDPRAGGTWLGVNAHGLVVAITNRPRQDAARGPMRSRGLLCLDLLACRSGAHAQEELRRQVTRHRFDGFNLFWADRDQAFCMHGDHRMDVFAVPPGLHLLANRDMDDATDVRLTRARALLGAVPDRPIDTWVDGLKRVCADHGTAGEPASSICIHARDHGTISSSVLAVGTGSRAVYCHAHGPPCVTPYQDYSHLAQRV